MKKFYAFLFVSDHQHKGLRQGRRTDLAIAKLFQFIERYNLQDIAIVVAFNKKVGGLNLTNIKQSISTAIGRQIASIKQSSRDINCELIMLEKRVHTVFQKTKTVLQYAAPYPEQEWRIFSPVIERSLISMWYETTAYFQKRKAA